LNPYAIYSEPSFTLQFFRRLERVLSGKNTNYGITIKSFDDLLWSNKRISEMSLTQFKEIISESVMKNAIEEQIELLENIGKTVKKKFKGRPKNLMPIPTLDRKLQGFTDVSLDDGSDDGISGDTIIGLMGKGIDGTDRLENPNGEYQTKLMDAVKRVIDNL
jgi:hypothetical protein